MTDRIRILDTPNNRAALARARARNRRFGPVNWKALFLGIIAGFVVAIGYCGPLFAGEVEVLASPDCGDPHIPPAYKEITHTSKGTFVFDYKCDLLSSDLTLPGGRLLPWHATGVEDIRELGGDVWVIGSHAVYRYDHPTDDLEMVLTFKAMVTGMFYWRRDRVVYGTLSESGRLPFHGFVWWSKEGGWKYSKYYGWDDHDLPAREVTLVPGGLKIIRGITWRDDDTSRDQVPIYFSWSTESFSSTPPGRNSGDE